LASDTGRDLVDRYIEVKEGRAREVRLKAKRERESWKQKKSKNGVTIKGQVDQSHKEVELGLEVSDDAIIQTPLGISEGELKSILSEVERLVEEKVKTVTGDVELVKSIDKKLKLCQNPENMPQSRM